MIRLLVVDDSALIRRLLGEIFAEEADIRLQFARDGLEGLSELTNFEPDVVVLDLQMPRMDGLTCLDRIMVERPTPVVVFSALTAEGAEATVEALELGAVDVVEKPSGAVSLQLDVFGPRLVEAVRNAARARIRRTHRLAERIRARGAPGASSLRPRWPSPAREPIARTKAPAREPGAGEPAAGCVLIGVSTGGPPALDAVLSQLPGDFPWAVLVAQHMPAAFTGPLARRLDGLCEMPVIEAAGPTPLHGGCVYVAHGDADIIVSARGGVPIALVAPVSAEHRWHPSVDRMVDSAMTQFPAERLIGVLMTGMGNDGAAAMTRLRRAGGRTIAEAEETAVVWGMPGELVRAGGAEAIEPLDRIARRILQMMPRP